LILGLAVLVASGDWLVRGGVSIANRFKVSTLVIGATVIAFGTSMPELIVSLNAAVDGHPELAMGNIIGSNIANIALVLGFAALVFPIAIQKRSVIFDWLIMTFSVLLLLIFIYNSNSLDFYEGIIFLIIIISFVWWSVRKSRKESKKEEFKKPKYSLSISVIIIILACTGLFLGSKLLVNSSVNIAKSLNVSEKIIGLTVVAFGTSIPELVTAIVAAVKKESDISVGSIIGSNTFNVFVVLGATSSVQRIKIDFNNIIFDMTYMMGIFLILLLMIIPIRKKLPIINRFKGGLLFVIYIIYIYYLITHDKI